MTSIVVAGDWHGDAVWGSAVIAAARQAGADIVWHVGDLGVGPWGMGRDRIGPGLARACAEHRVQVWATAGNHENHRTWDHALQTPDATGLGQLAPGVLLLPRPHRWTVDDRRIGSLGGAFSIDRGRRTPELDWWPQERVTSEQVLALGDEPLDVLVTHEVPAGAAVDKAFRLPRHLEIEADADRDLVARAVLATAPRLVLCGHWHQRRTLDLGATRVEVLDRERTEGNAVVLDTRTLKVSPLEV